MLWGWEEGNRQGVGKISCMQYLSGCASVLLCEARRRLWGVLSAPCVFVCMCRARASSRFARRRIGRDACIGIARRRLSLFCALVVIVCGRNYNAINSISLLSEQ